jgi:hypothetical protein
LQSRIALLVVGVLLLSQVAAQRQVMGQEHCTGKYKGLAPSPAELKEILARHAEWVRDGGTDNPKMANDPRRVNLCEANLASADLTGVNLSGARLDGINLVFARLSKAILLRADLEGGSLLPNRSNGL